MTIQRYTRRHFLVIALIFSVFVNMLMLTGPLFMLQVYDRVLGSQSEETLVALTVLVLGLYGLMWLLDFARTRLLARHGARIQVALDGKVYAKQLMTRDQTHEARAAVKNVDTVQAFYGSPAVPAMMDAPFTPVFIAVIFIFHPMLGWFALGGAGTLVVISVTNQFLTTRRLETSNRAAFEALAFGESANRASELVKAQGMLNAVVDRFVDKRGEALDQNMSAVDWTGAFSSFTKAFRLSLQSLVLALGAWLVLQGQITAGAMIAASILLGRALAPLEQIIGQWVMISRFRKAHRALNVLLEDDEIGQGRVNLPDPKGQLDVLDVTVVAAPDSPPILRRVSFSVAPGEVVGVIGRSGSGKTTLAKTVLGLVSPVGGDVRLDRALIGQYAPKDFGRYVGYLPQEPVFISGTIAENIARMAMQPDSAAIIEAAKKAQVHDLILFLPDGYDTQVDDARIGLSGGQKQRIALARAVFGNPVLLVLDEPNSALDQEGSEALNAVIRTMKSEGSAVIIMTHRPFAVKECDRILVVEEGQIAADGSRDDIIKGMMKNATDIRRNVGAQS